MLTIISLGNQLTLANWQVWLTAIFTALIPIVFHVLRGIGLYKLAKDKKLKSAFMAWIPFVWVFVAIKLISETRFFGKKIGNFAVVITVIFALAEVLTLTYEFMAYFPFIGNYLMGNQIIVDSTVYENLPTNYYELWANFGVYGVQGTFVNPYKNIDLIVKIMNGIYYVSAVLDILSAVIIVTVFSNLFKKYWPQHFVVASILSLFGLDGIFIFLIRNKKPVKYTDYLRSRYQQYGPYGPYGPNPYGPNPYGQNPYANQGNSTPSEPESPFEQFQDEKDKKPEEPFSDFSDKK